MKDQYDILHYSYTVAKKLGVDIKPSLLKNKKIDVYKNGKKITSIGAKGMMDYPTYVKLKGTAYANERRRLYKARHDKTRHVIGSASWYADRILW